MDDKDKRVDALFPKRLLRSPTQVMDPAQLVVPMAYRLYLPEATVLFVMQSLAADKGLAKVTISAVRGATELKAGSTVDLQLSVLGIHPLKTVGPEQWYPHWTETAADAYVPPQQNAPGYPGITQAFAGGVFESLDEAYAQADLKQLSISNRKVSVENWRLWAPEMQRWYAMSGAQPQEIAFSDMIYYPDGRLAIKCEKYWAVLNPKR